ncbi:hypothetical protein [Luteococcus peritonei]|uniref:DUF308 domain-containing protein n=1 Tax=Luteococcus peritonei TaxID=88874 RepID=A0ABW4RQM1_9ACTN
MSTEETGDRFEQIMRAEFGDDPSFSAGPSDDDVARVERDRRPRRRPSAPPESPEDSAGRPQESTRGDHAEPFNLSRAMEQASGDEPDEPFVPPSPSPLPRPRGAVLVGSLLLGAGILLGLLGLLGLDLGLGRHWGRWAVAAFAVGLAVLLLNLPRTPRDPWDDGARV